MTVYFVRHGQTSKNREKRLQGRSDMPLDGTGERQVMRVRDFFAERGIRFDRVFSSPLTRAVQTARIIAGDDAEIVCDDRLLEMDYGPYEGISLENPPPELIRFFSDFVRNPAPDGMETLAHVVSRMGEFTESLKGEDAGTILVATHAIALKGALEYLTPGSDGAYWSRYIPTCGVYAAELSDGTFSVPEAVLCEGGEPGV